MMILMNGLVVLKQKIILQTNIRIKIIMSQSHEDDQGCFIPANWDISTLQATKEKDIPYLNINKLLQQAKELHNPMRPQQFSARTCFLELPLYKLPDFLQDECVEEEQISKEVKQINAIQNPDELTIQQYFREYEIVYDKMRMYTNPNFLLPESTSRFKPITHLSSDFHQKLFKQLYTLDTKNSSTHIAINDQFDSNFQCGNLGIVYKKPETLDREYYLLLENDINTHGYTSWFFFKVKSCGKGRAYFHITNLSKSSYLYRIGWKISTFSVSKYHEKFTKWVKGGINIQTYSTNFEKKSKGGGTYNCLYFEYEFDQNQTDVYFAMSRPYTYTMLTKSIQKMQKQSKKKSISMQIINTIYSISCNLIPVVVLNNILTTKQNKLQIQNVLLDKTKKCIIFMARQHPGEVVGSQYMEKVMKVMTSEGEQIKFLLAKFNIILMPMINPDGVIHGNSRCNLGGLDLNRQWMKQNLKQVTPQTFYLRKFIWEIHERIGVQLLIDLHGHSKKMNSFCFSNKIGDKLPAEYFPFLIAKFDKRFDLGSCTFNTTPDKKNTLRNQLYQFGMKNCVTVQNSYFGYWEQKTAKLFKDSDYQEMAHSLIKSLHMVLCLEQTQMGKISLKIGQFREQLMTELKSCKQIIMKKNSTKSSINDDIQSESDPEGDIMKPEQMMKIYQYPQVLSKKKNQAGKSKKLKEKKIKQVVSKEEDIRVSQPMRNYREYYNAQSKNHRSQKKLEVVIPNPKKNVTQQRFRQTFIKPMIPLSKKMIEKREGAIKQTFLSMNQNQEAKDQKDIGKQSILKNKYLGNPFNKFENQGALINNKNKKNQSRIKTDISEQRPLKYQPSLKFAQYQRMRQERLKLFLNETLSIIKVENQQGNTTYNQSSEMSKRKNSLKQQKFAQKSNYRLNTQGKSNKNQMILQIDNQLNPGMSIAKQREQRKRFLSRNYKKELTKRKRILNTHSIQQAKKYRRFENFVESAQNPGKKQSVKLQCNSVFYYFPVL